MEIVDHNAPLVLPRLIEGEDLREGLTRQPDVVLANPPKFPAAAARLGVRFRRLALVVERQAFEGRRVRVLGVSRGRVGFRTPLSWRVPMVIAAGVAGVLCASVLPAGADGGSGSSVVAETFRFPVPVNPHGWVSSGNFRPCLTAGTNTGATPIPGCGLGTPDSPGNGVLRLTNTGISEAGDLFSTNALPTGWGLNATFDESQWGGAVFDGSGHTGDGISFFLVNGSSSSTSPGNIGGALGYVGVTNGLLGIGFDSFGNFSNVSGSGCTEPLGTPGSPGTGTTIPDQVVIRGPGSGSSGFCWLGASGPLTAYGIQLGNLSAGAGTRASKEMQVRIAIDPNPYLTVPHGHVNVLQRDITVWLDGIQVVHVPLPEAFIDAWSFKIAFGGATGGSTDNHEVWNLVAASQ